MVRVRFAPSPTGFLHIGGLRTALYNELFAMRHGGVFVLRIEDTDRTRLVAGAVENILRTLAWAGMAPAEGPYLDTDGVLKERGSHGPYVQSARRDLYRKHAEQLLKSGNAYRCFCTPERLEEVKKRQAEGGQSMMYDKRCRALPQEEVDGHMARKAHHVIRLKVPEAGATAFDDAIRGTVSFENKLIDDQVLLKSDGFPTYHLANVVDDHAMDISHVIRGEEWLPSTPKHVLLYQAFGWTSPVYAHLPLLLNPDRSKLSKRQGDVAVEDYREQGYLPEALVNFVALLGWNPSASQEIYTKEELAKEFALEKINRGGAVFNREKLDWLNREYLKKLSDERLAELALPFFVRAGTLREGSYDKALFTKALALERQRVKTLAEFPEATAFLFVKELAYDPELLPWKTSTAAVAKGRLEGLIEHVRSMTDTSFADPKSLEKEITGFIAEKGWTNADTLWPMRVALTGRKASPSPFEVAWALGKETTLGRLQNAVTSLA